MMRRSVLLCLTALTVLSGGIATAKPPTRTLEKDGYRLELSLGPQVLGIEMAEDLEWGNLHGKIEAPIAPRISRTSGTFLSASVLAQKAKIFDDGLYAAVELAAQERKRELLATLAAVLGDGSARGPGNVVLAAAGLGGARLDLPERVDSAVSRLTDGFLAAPLRSKPISFYTWSDELRRVFRQDRMLQTELSGAKGIAKIVRALHADPKARETYEWYLALVSKLTNPLAGDSLAGLLADLDGGGFDAPEKGVGFFPPSRAHETDLVRKLYGGRPIPDGFNLADEMIARIRAGEIDLSPKPASGWYDYQTWALEPLVIPDRMPEAGRLKLGEKYREQLVKLFKGLLALTRETHIKQLEIPSPGSAMEIPSFDVYPELSAEPTASFYFRRAESYAFVRRALADALGAEALAELHRLTEDGPSIDALSTELEAMEALFRGAYVSVSLDLGTDLALSSAEEEAHLVFSIFSESWQEDSDLSRDVRAMVPVFFDVGRQKMKVWLFLGWATRPATVWFETKPVARAFGPDGDPVTGANAPRIRFKSRGYGLIYPVTAEVHVDRILDRREFRALCDRHRTRSKILGALE